MSESMSTAVGSRKRTGEVIRAEGLGKTYAEGDAAHAGVRRPGPGGACRRDRRDRRRLRRGQEHAAAPARRAGHADRGRGVRRRPADERAVRRRARHAAQPRARLRLPVPPPAARIHRAGERDAAGAAQRHADAEAARSARRHCWNRSGWAIASSTSPANCPAASASAPRSRARWSTSPPACSATSRPATSTRRPPRRCSS